MPKKIRELKAQLRKAGFVLLVKRGKGSHSRWKHPLLPGTLTLSGSDSSDAKPYQEIDVRNALQQLEDIQEDSDDTL